MSISGVPDVGPTHGGEGFHKRIIAPGTGKGTQRRNIVDPGSFLGSEWPMNIRLDHLQKQKVGQNCRPSGRVCKDGNRHRAVLIKFCLMDIHPNPGLRAEDRQQMGREEGLGNASNEKKRKAQRKEVREVDAPATRPEEPQKTIEALTGVPVQSEGNANRDAEPTTVQNSSRREISNPARSGNDKATKLGRGILILNII